MRPRSCASLLFVNCNLVDPASLFVSCCGRFQHQLWNSWAAPAYQLIWHSDFLHQYVVPDNQVLIVSVSHPRPLRIILTPLCIEDSCTRSSTFERCQLSKQVTQILRHDWAAQCEGLVSYEGLCQKKYTKSLMRDQEQLF